MQPLPTIQNILTFTCLCSPYDGPPKLANIIITLFFITTQVIGCLTPTLFIIKHIATIDLERLLFACITTLNRSSMLYVILIAFISRNKIPVIFKDLSRIYTSRKMRIWFMLIMFNIHKKTFVQINISDENDPAYRFLVDANVKAEQFLRTYLKIVMGSFYGLLISGIIASFVVCVRKYGHFDRKHVFVPYKSV